MPTAEQPRFTSEHDFWTSQPNYPVDSLPAPALPEARPEPSRRRLLLAKVLFVSVLSGVMFLLGYAVSLKLGMASTRVGEVPTHAR